MAKRRTNNLKWIADLKKLTETIDPETDRVVVGYETVRAIRYNNIGVTATDKLTTKDTNEVVKKIETRIDRELENNQKFYRVQIGDKIYQVERIYTREDEKMMEVSLAYAD